MRLNTPTGKNGISRRRTLEGNRKQLKKAGKTEQELAERFKELQPVELEPNTDRLLLIFDDLSNTRSYSMSGPMPLTYMEIKAYVELLGEDLTSLEVKTIKGMDQAFIQESYKLLGANNNG